MTDAREFGRGSMDQNKHNTKKHERRKRHVRKRVYGVSERPRLTVFRSVRHLYAQIVDDDAGRTLVAAGSRDKELAGKVAGKGNASEAGEVGAVLAKKATDMGIRQVVFDRNGYRFHGRVKALAEAVREGGVSF